jgi:hypothetical protein
VVIEPKLSEFDKLLESAKGAGEVEPSRESIAAV